MRLLLLLLLLLASCKLTGCTLPLPPTGEQAGQWGYVDVNVRYRPNVGSLLERFRQPNPDLPDPETTGQRK